MTLYALPTLQASVIVPHQVLPVKMAFVRIINHLNFDFKKIWYSVHMLNTRWYNFKKSQ